ncbi:unnamed protein product [Dicrocoelium dendriticum]|nr:unnamed protein product [Dicrocoelium dendriticum]
MFFFRFSMGRTNRGFQMSLSWIPGQDGFIPNNAIALEDGTSICRAEHESAVVPGYLIPGTKYARIGYHGSVLEKSSYEVLCTTGVQCACTHYWKSDREGLVPSDSVIAGMAPEKLPLYIARTQIADKDVLGYVFAEERCAYFVHEDSVVSRDVYEVLVWEKNLLV